MRTDSQTLNYVSLTTMKPQIEQKPVGRRLLENNLEDFLP